MVEMPQTVSPHIVATSRLPATLGNRLLSFAMSNNRINERPTDFRPMSPSRIRTGTRGKFSVSTQRQFECETLGQVRVFGFNNSRSSGVSWKNLLLLRDPIEATNVKRKCWVCFGRFTACNMSITEPAQHWRLSGK